MDEIQKEQERLRALAAGIVSILQDATRLTEEDLDACELDAEYLLEGLRVLYTKVADAAVK